jgi:ribosomal protein S18 acetylase RimI-like enzyme
MKIRPFHPDDAPALVELSAWCARGENDFVLNPYWEGEEELFAEFERFGIEPAEHLLVADSGDGERFGLAGFLRLPEASTAGLFCPIVKRSARGRGLGGELLRGALRLGEELEITLATAAIGTRNRAGYSLLTSHGFRPVRQHFLMRCNTSQAAESPLDGVAFREAAPDDAPAILSIYDVCGFEPRSPEAMERALADARHVHAVAHEGERVVAFVELETHWPRRVWVAYVGVAPELRDRGLGSSLVSWALARRFETGAQSALLMLSPANRTAVRAYEKVGFRRHRLVDVLERAI